ncbi:MAG: hypothetical protein JKY65_05505 [Planctomycetes bacterium]|nr:hypothetical protein [Planctomycetota bacterium]
MRIEFHIEGVGHKIKPESLDLANLFPLLDHFRRALVYAAGKDPDGDEWPRVSLVGVGGGSCTTSIDCDPALNESTRILGKAVTSGRWSSLPGASSHAHRELFSLYGSLAAQRLSLEARAEGPDGQVLFAISRSSPVPDPPPATEGLRVKGETVIYPKVTGVRLGAKKGRAWLRIDQQRLEIDSSCSLPVARKLKEKIEFVVGLRGEAEWEVSGWKIVGFEIHEVLPYQPGSLVETFEKLRELAGDAYEGVDPIEFTKELRAD